MFLAAATIGGGDPDYDDLSHPGQQYFHIDQHIIRKCLDLEWLDLLF